jgi:hypothetical protein
MRVRKGAFYGFCRFGHRREPVGAFGWIPVATIEAFPGGRVWLDLHRIRHAAGYASCCLAKRSWALLRSNPARDSQAKAGE